MFVLTPTVLRYLRMGVSDHIFTVQYKFKVLGGITLLLKYAGSVFKSCTCIHVEGRKRFENAVRVDGNILKTEGSICIFKRKRIPVDRS